MSFRASDRLSTGDLIRRWLPLAVGRLCMCAEAPLAAYAVAIMPDASLNLQCVAGILIPVGWLFESPVWNLLGSSAALIRRVDDFRAFRAFVFRLSFCIAVLYYVFALGPLSSWLICDVLGAPSDLLQHSRTALLFAAVWPFAVGYRRICQGVLISAGQSRCVSFTSIFRLCTLLVLLFVFVSLSGPFSGVSAASCAITTSLSLEALLAHYLFVRFGRPNLSAEPSSLSPMEVARYCGPLMSSSLLGAIWTPVGSALMFRLPDPELSLTAWPALSGLYLVIRTPAFAMTELTAAFGSDRSSARKIAHIAFFGGLVLSLATLFLSLSGGGEMYFRVVGALPDQLAHFAAVALIYSFLWPALEMLYNLLAGLTYSWKKTRFILEAKFFGVAVLVLASGLGIWLRPFPGAIHYLLTIMACYLAECLWVIWRLKATSPPQA